MLSENSRCHATPRAPFFSCLPLVANTKKRGEETHKTIKRWSTRTHSCPSPSLPLPSSPLLPSLPPSPLLLTPFKTLFREEQRHAKVCYTFFSLQIWNILYIKYSRSLFDFNFTDISIQLYLYKISYCIKLHLDNFKSKM